MYYINYFFIFSIIGHLVESALFKESGILFGYWTPVYGFGAVIILIINKMLKNIKASTFKKILLLFFSCFIFLSLIEAIGGYLIKWIFNAELWDYSKLKFHIGKYVSLEIATIWGLCSILLIYILKPMFDKIVKKIPNFITGIFIILFLIDNIYTLILK